MRKLEVCEARAKQEKILKNTNSERSDGLMKKSFLENPALRFISKAEPEHSPTGSEQPPEVQAC